MSDLFQRAQAMRYAGSPENDFIVSLAGDYMQETPTEPVWQWAARNVYLDEKMTSEPGYFDPTKTPWTKEWQELPMRPEVREAVAMKSSRTGFSEGSLNILRWMVKHWPGNALYSINSDKKAREVAERRILPSIERTAGAQLSEDPDDNTLSKISLRNMDILISGSGSSGPFMEIWYRLIVLDELSKHAKRADGTTTYDQAKSRQNDVADGLLMALSVPEEAGGIIDLKYTNGTQKKFLVPCPRCERRIELLFDYLLADHCKDGDHRYNLDLVVAETVYQCQLCGQPIEEKEKYAMVNEGIWVPTSNDKRRRSPAGDYVPPEPGVESYQISDLYSLHKRVTWGMLKKLWLQAYVINPTDEAKKYVITNHGGLPWEQEATNVTKESIEALKAGRIEEQRVKAADGTESTIKVHLGQPFRMAYRDGEFNARLPFCPAMLFMTTDKQFDYLKYLVFAWSNSGESYLVDCGRLQDEDQLWRLRTREYKVEGRKRPRHIDSGLIDCGHRRDEVYKACLLHQMQPCIIHPGGWKIFPARGSGENEGHAGKLLMLKKDYLDSHEITVRVFYDHGIKNQFYLGQIQKRDEPRLWLPVDLPSAISSEWTAEIYDKAEKKWKHDKQKRGPNDYGDCGKMQFVGKIEFGGALQNIHWPDD
ncbi:MAG TPA: phage terminase large subunit family protein [Prosthecobacter sp.]|nr:phage terminase large subunit family protein [Prosthecobacter sp.]HRK15060.1 phage terminase large subunit family protein [Prosthecobacter sp.]